MVGNSGKNFASICRTVEEKILKAFLVLKVTMLLKEVPILAASKTSQFTS